MEAREPDRERELLDRLAEAERLLVAVPDLERELAETIRERNGAIVELEQQASGARMSCALSSSATRRRSRGSVNRSA